MLRSKGFATEEIPGGCFCCRFNSLVEAARKLNARSRPEVFIAEPVGSCTDLVATVTYPLRRMYGADFTVAPVSVLVDPVRAMRVFGLVEGAGFSEKVRYIYRKQLEEADLIIINKRDTLSQAQLDRLRAKLEAEFPHGPVLAVSARNREGLESWFERIISTDQVARRAMEVDYEVYAQGEALLGWLNCTVRMSSPRPWDANLALRRLAGRIQATLKATGAEMAHLKMTLSPDEGLGDVAVINLVRNDFVPELTQELPGRLRSGELIINCRAETAPETLLQVVQEALAEEGRQPLDLSLRLEHSEHFRPGKPQPTHRIAEMTARS
jgi:G3E family GTPase